MGKSMSNIKVYSQNIWDKVFKSGLSKFFKVCLPQIFSLLLNTLSHIRVIHNKYTWDCNLEFKKLLEIDIVVIIHNK